MVIDKIGLGRKGEMYILQKLLGFGWSLPSNYHKSMIGLDWVFEKGNRQILLQVKTSEKKRITFLITKKTFDYLIVTNLEDVWIIPKEMFGNTNSLNKVYKKLINKFELLDLEGPELLGAINDCGVRFSDISQPSKFFKQKNNIY